VAPTKRELAGLVREMEACSAKLSRDEARRSGELCSIVVVDACRGLTGVVCVGDAASGDQYRRLPSPIAEELSTGAVAPARLLGD